ncbi:hypothetical protein G7054_g7823 [Neopestalotiopsis clavispora]|nr:hypothetical protein G7054_g7823 [Neopestalotiopsis clavispora]
MGDLFTPHPTRKNAWKYVSPADDMIVMANGYKYLPTYFEEEVLGEDARIESASIYRAAKEHLAVIVELVDPPPPAYFENKDKAIGSTAAGSAPKHSADPVVEEIWSVIRERLQPGPICPWDGAGAIQYLP